MFSRLRRSSRRGRKAARSEEREYSPFADVTETSRNRVVGGQATETELDDEDEDDQYGPSPNVRSRGGPSYFDHVPQRRYHDDPDEEDEDEDGERVGEDAINTPLLPIFSAPHLDRLPLYNITHSIRLLIVQKCETTLSWDQLRSPQVSQFLVKPVQNDIRANHFNRATLCALIANCLQFQKEGAMNPGNVGVSKTRALVSELLAMRLIKEFTTREMIDALSYDFDPLQGMVVNGGRNTSGQVLPAIQDVQARKAQAIGARVSTIEIAIRAQAKRFLAHSLVVQHLEAIWAGTIVFHAEADSLHRRPASDHEHEEDRPGYGTMHDHAPSILPADHPMSRKTNNSQTRRRSVTDQRPTRRSVTLYNPREASLFKLSRLRVPRYRQVLATFSFATMLGLFIAVLVDRSISITPLEVVFWIWSAGYMLDEIVGFTEQGFGLYILSFWNAFDLGILLLFVTYYCLRLYGIVIADQGKHHIASMAYDVLASTAVLLFPRLFSVLDHYRYFSQLLIAFRMMAQDLMAVLVLILISCSGFFVAFTLSFSDEKTDANAVAFALFQIVMGFTPAAWDKWPGFNLLGKAIMMCFLVICHFLIVTILITVLTNSFMAIVRNAEEEHQFLFAINTISMVKSDALFSYIAPTNVIGWTLSPLRYVLPIRQYVRLNRYIIKITHFPVLLVIFGYERAILTSYTYEPTDLIEKTGKNAAKPLAFSINKAPDTFSPGHRLREPSVISFNKTRALDEVFRRPFRGSTVRTTTREMDGNRREPNAVDQWMQVADEEGGASPPLEQPRSVLELLENRRPKNKRAVTNERFSRMAKGSYLSTATKSVVSDPDILSISASRRPQRIDEESEMMDDDNLPQETDADGDDEINDESDAAPMLGESAISISNKENMAPDNDSDEDEYFPGGMASRPAFMQMSSAAQARMQDVADVLQPPGPPPARQVGNRAHHARNTSTATILHAPDTPYDSSASNRVQQQSRPMTGRNTGANTPKPNLSQQSKGTKTPLLTKPRQQPQAKPRPIMPPRQATAPAGALGGLSYLNLPSRDSDHIHSNDERNRNRNTQTRNTNRIPSFSARALDLASEIGDNRFTQPLPGADMMPASFNEQFLQSRETALRIAEQRAEERRRSEEEEKGMVNRIMLARMNTLEEGFREVLREIKDLSVAAGSTRRNSENEFAGGGGKKRGKRDGNASSSPVWGSLPKVGGMSRFESNKARRSPKKVVRRGKGKEVVGERPSSGSAREKERVVGTPSPKSVVSVEDEEVERPGTAVRYEAGGSKSEE